MNVVSQIIDSLDGDYTNEAICSALGSWTWDDPFKEEWRSFIVLRWIDLWPELSCETRLVLFAEASVACMKRNNLRDRGLHEVWRGKGEPLELSDAMGSNDDEFQQR